MKTLIIGNSHAHAIKVAAARFAGAAQYEVHRLGDKPDTLDARPLSHLDAADRIKQLEPDDVLVILCGGTMHNPVSLLRHREPFDVLAVGEEAGDLPIITQSLLKSAFTASAWSERNTIKQYRDWTAARVIHLATPPPIADREFIIARRVKKYHGLWITEDSLNPEPFRLKIWNIEMQALTKVCEELGIEFLYPPVRALTPEGYLSRECCADDAAHANERYGRLVLEQLDAAFYPAAPREMAMA